MKIKLPGEQPLIRGGSQVAHVVPDSPMHRHHVRDAARNALTKDLIVEFQLPQELPILVVQPLYSTGWVFELPKGRKLG